MNYLRAISLTIRLALPTQGWEGQNIPLATAWKVAAQIHLGK